MINMTFVKYVVTNIWSALLYLSYMCYYLCIFKNQGLYLTFEVYVKPEYFCVALIWLLKHYETKINFLQELNVIQSRFQIENSVSPGFFRKLVDSAHTSFCAHYLPLDCSRLMSQ